MSDDVTEIESTRIEIGNLKTTINEKHILIDNAHHEIELLQTDLKNALGTIQSLHLEQESYKKRCGRIEGKSYRIGKGRYFSGPNFSGPNFSTLEHNFRFEVENG